MKVYELARELGLSSREIMDYLAELPEDVPANHFAALSEEQANAARRHFIRRVIMATAPLDSRSGTKDLEEAKEIREPKPADIVRRRGSSAQAIIKGSTPKTTPPQQLFGVGIQNKQPK